MSDRPRNSEAFRPGRPWPEGLKHTREYVSVVRSSPYVLIWRRERAFRVNRPRALNFGGWE